MNGRHMALEIPRLAPIMVRHNRSRGGSAVRSIVYACVAAVLIAVAVAVVLYLVEGPPGSHFAVPGTVRL